MLCPRKNSGTVSLRFGYVPEFWGLSAISPKKFGDWDRKLALWQCPRIFPMCYQTHRRPDTVFRPGRQRRRSIYPHCLRIAFKTWNTHNWIYMWGNSNTLLLERLNLCKILVDLWWWHECSRRVSLKPYCLGKNSRILTNFIMDMNVLKLWNNYAKNRPRDLTTDRTGRMLDCRHRGQTVTLKTVQLQPFTFIMQLGLLALNGNRAL